MFPPYVLFVSPTHHKQAKSSSSSPGSSTPFSLTTSDIEQVVLRAFQDACDAIKPLDVNDVLDKNGYRTLSGLSQFIRKQLNASKLSPRGSQSTEEQDEEEVGSDSSTNDENDSESGEQTDPREDDGNEELHFGLTECFIQRDANIRID